VHNLTQDELRELSVKDMNGREIKNVMKLAIALAEHEMHEKEPLSFKTFSPNNEHDEGFPSDHRISECKVSTSQLPRI